MAVRRRPEPLRPPVSPEPSSPARSSQAPPVTSAAAPRDTAEAATATRFDEVLRLDAPALAHRPARMMSRMIHEGTLELAARHRDAGDPANGVALLRGLRVLSPSRGVPTDAAFLAGANDAAPPALAQTDRLDAVLTVLQGDEPTRERLSPSLRLDWLNDQFFFPNGDDDGFTQAANLGFTLRRGADALDLDVRHGMLTERGGDRRVDELDIVMGVSRRVEEGDLQFTFGSHIGVSLVGTYGGAQLQDGFHGLIGMGRRLDGTLQDNYEGPNQAGLIVGADVTARRSLGAGFAASAGVDGQLVVGPTGVSHVAPRVGVDFEWPKSGLRPVASAELTLAKFFTPDARLQMPGGYDTQHIEAIPRFSIGLRTDHFEIGWQGTVNQNGSGANMGNIYLSIGAPR